MVLINLLGGTAVLASYVWGLLVDWEATGTLWGGVPEWARGLYTVNMFLAAAGYLLFTPYIVFRLLPRAESRSDRSMPRTCALLYLAILIPSALWLPLTFMMSNAPSAALWWLIRLDLVAVAVGSAGLLVLLLRVEAEHRAPGHGWAVVGLLPFCLQTVVLDAIVWPIYFPTGGA